MTLDLARLSAAIGAMGDDLAANHAALAERSARARELLATADGAALAEAAEAQRAAIRPVEPPAARYLAPASLVGYQVLAADGSDIEPDRHGAALCYVVNVGWTVIQYGAEPWANLGSNPTLYYRPDDLYVREGNRQAPIQGSRLGAKRAVAEIQRLAVLVAEASPASREPSLELGETCGAEASPESRGPSAEFGGARGAEASPESWVPRPELGETRAAVAPPRVALSDGLLLLGNYWEGPEAFVRDYFVGQFKAALERLRALDVPVGAYVSRPRGADVVALLRLDPRHQAECAWCRRQGTDRETCALEGLVDRRLFEELPAGARSALFESRALAQHYPAELLPRFFYLNVGREIARIELPTWAAARPELVDRVHAVLVDQCRRGQGYPVALARAHEQAVIGGVERQRFDELVARALVVRGLPDHPSEKQASKLARAV